jgi:hypothetical protein
VFAQNILPSVKVNNMWVLFLKPYPRPCLTRHNPPGAPCILSMWYLGY